MCVCERETEIDRNRETESPTLMECLRSRCGSFLLVSCGVWHEELDTSPSYHLSVAETLPLVSGLLERGRETERRDEERKGGRRERERGGESIRKRWSKEGGKGRRERERGREGEREGGRERGEREGRKRRKDKREGEANRGERERREVRKEGTRNKRKAKVIGMMLTCIHKW